MDQEEQVLSTENVIAGWNANPNVEENESGSHDVIVSWIETSANENVSAYRPWKRLRESPRAQRWIRPPRNRQSLLARQMAEDAGEERRHVEVKTRILRQKCRDSWRLMIRP